MHKKIDDDTIYSESFSRNIGILTQDEQEALRKKKIAVLGLGGIGGPCFEVLVRTGIDAFHIVDNDVFELSNINRQVHANSRTLGKRKIDVAKASALDINKTLGISEFYEVTETNIEEILDGCTAVVHGIDRLKPCIISDREARKRGIPTVEGWAMPFGNVRVLSKDTPSLEQVHQLPTMGRPLSEFTDDQFLQYEFMILDQLSHIEHVMDHYTDGIMEQIKQGMSPPSFAPMVWFTSAMMAIEVIKICLGRGHLALGPQFTVYDPFEHQKRQIVTDHTDGQQ